MMKRLQIQVRNLFTLFRSHLAFNVKSPKTSVMLALVSSLKLVQSPQHTVDAEGYCQSNGALVGVSRSIRSLRVSCDRDVFDEVSNSWSEVINRFLQQNKTVVRTVIHFLERKQSKNKSGAGTAEKEVWKSVLFRFAVEFAYIRTLREMRIAQFLCCNDEVL